MKHTPHLLLAEVILPLGVRSNFHYLIPESIQHEAIPGKRVLVRFGKGKKIYTGLIRSVSHELPPGTERGRLLPVDAVLDENPILSPIQMSLYEWVGYYYMCTVGEVFKAALPSGMKPESALRVESVRPSGWEDLGLDDKSYLLMEALQIQPVLTLPEIAQIWDLVHIMPRLRALEARQLIRVYHQVEETYKPRYKTYLKLTGPYTQPAHQAAALDSLSRAPGQENLLLRLIQAHQRDQLVPRAEILKELKIAGSAVQALIHKGIVAEELVQLDRLELYGYTPSHKVIAFTEQQQAALRQIRATFAETPRRPVLLHGVTGSGKTHIYIELMREAIAQGKQALYLLPEITLTKQIIDRVRSELGEAVGVYHSRFSDAERVEIWQKVCSGQYKAVIGVRSAIFLPFQTLGLIVVDEEHDPSFKQHEPAPRYHARDVALYYAQLADCPILLGSATPAFETYHNSLSGKYVRVDMTRRAVAARMPLIQLVNLRDKSLKGQQRGIFSGVLYDAILEALSRKEQIILFQNRRGYAPYLVCETCGLTPECINCDISLTFHKEHQHLRCHYCGYTDFSIHKCPSCGNFTLRYAGIGTEKIEEEVKTHFPDATVMRMDWDTTRGKTGYQQIITRFENQEVDILAGTQMVSKGLDFENVTLVGVIQADPLLAFPDFRAWERAYQLLTQVSGRAGRSQKQGRVIIQTQMPDNLVLQSLEKPYVEFYRQESPTRQQVGYPPYTRLIRIGMHHKDADFLETESQRLTGLLKPFFGQNLLGPDYALIARVRNTYRMHLLLKIARNTQPQKLRDILHQTLEAYYTQAPVKTLRIVVDVDPI